MKWATKIKPKVQNLGKEIWGMWGHWQDGREKKEGCVRHVIRIHARPWNCQRTESNNKKEVTATVLDLWLLISEMRGHSLVLYVLRVLNSKSVLLLVYRFPPSLSTVILTYAGLREPSMRQKKCYPSFLPPLSSLRAHIYDLIIFRNSEQTKAEVKVVWISCLWVIYKS